MTNRNPVNKILAWYHLHYDMPEECKIECALRNIRRVKIILPMTLVFGIVMTGENLLFQPWSNPEFWIVISYYSMYIGFSLIPLGLFKLLKNKKGTFAAQNVVCYTILTIAQFLCMYQRLISHNSEGYLVWTIATITIIALFNIKPSFFLVSMLIQFILTVLYESANGKTYFLNLGLLVLITIILSYTHWSRTIRDFLNLAAIKAANAKSDELLQNILPPRVIQDLREKGTTEPELFEQVSILFTDLVNFTEISSSLAPEYLIGELSDLFCGFDCIIEKYGCTRIKTIGDSYMAVCGLPEGDPYHARKIVQAGLECIDYLAKRNEHSPIKWKMRVGAHSGSVVAGIVGARKYIYDVFGDTVNIASRMENSSNEMRLNVSEETYKRTKDDFMFETREPQRVKGKGYMTMYFANHADVDAVEIIDAEEID